MNLAKNEEKIKAAIKELDGNNKKDTASFLTLQQALRLPTARAVAAAMVEMITTVSKGSLAPAQARRPDLRRVAV
jgi:hypothetical protein